MKIAIDLNDVLRDFSNNFVRYYLEGYNHEFDLTDFEFWTYRMDNLLPFQSNNSYYNFIYNDYAFELFGKCPVCERGLETKLEVWTEKIIKDFDINEDFNRDEEIEVMFVSPLEYGPSIGNTYFFLSKLGTKIGESYFPDNMLKIWDKCDVLITANTDLLNSKPSDKITVKISREYNKDSEADFEYRDFSTFAAEKENTEIIVKKYLGDEKK
jgi:hypothetical protein